MDESEAFEHHDLRASPILQDASSAAAGHDAAAGPPSEQIAKIPTGNNHSRPAHFIRLIRDHKLAIVRGCVFDFFHRLEGKWSGELYEVVLPDFQNSSSSAILASASKIDGDHGPFPSDNIPRQRDGQTTMTVNSNHNNINEAISGVAGNVLMTAAPRAVSVKIHFDHEMGSWVLRETRAAADGAATNQLFRMMPCGNGSLSMQPIYDPPGGMTSVEAAAHHHSGSALLREIPGGAILEQRQPLTGHLVMQEIIALSPAGLLTRTRNNYGEATGELHTITVSRQRRVCE